MLNFIAVRGRWRECGGRGDTCRRTEVNVLCEGEEGIRLGPS